MPRIKGWKKIADDEEVVMWINTEIPTYVVRVIRGDLLYHPKKGWFFDFSKNYTIKNSKQFNKKSDALKFATKWMKKYPNG